MLIEIAHDEWVDPEKILRVTRASNVKIDGRCRLYVTHEQGIDSFTIDKPGREVAGKINAFLELDPKYRLYVPIATVDSSGNPMLQHHTTTHAPCPTTPSATAQAQDVKQLRKDHNDVTLAQDILDANLFRKDELPHPATGEPQ